MNKQEDHSVEALLCLVFVMLGLMVFAPSHLGALLGEAALFAAIGSGCMLAPHLRRAVSSMATRLRPDISPSAPARSGSEPLKAVL